MRTYKVQRTLFMRKLNHIKWRTLERRQGHLSPAGAHLPCSPRVLAIPVFTLDVLTWLMRFSCSGLTNTATLMFHSDCIAIYGESVGSPLPQAKVPAYTPYAYQLHYLVSHGLARLAVPF